MSQKPTTRITTDHKEIREWVEKKGGRPSKVKYEGEGENQGILRIDIIDGDGPEDALEEISWEDFFEIFEKKRLAFLYDIEPESRFSKFISRN